MTFPVLDREPVRLPTLAGHDDELWDALIELSEVRPGEWTLIGGQMVFLHAIEQGASPPRVSTDLDVLINARIAARSGHIPRPSLLGAVVAKALAVAIDDAPAAQRLDFVFLLSLISDPLALAAELTPKDRRRIRARKELLTGEHRVWNELETHFWCRGPCDLIVRSVI